MVVNQSVLVVVTTTFCLQGCKNSKHPGSPEGFIEDIQEKFQNRLDKNSFEEVGSGGFGDVHSANVICQSSGARKVIIKVEETIDERNVRAHHAMRRQNDQNRIQNHVFLSDFVQNSIFY